MVRRTIIFDALAPDLNDLVRAVRMQMKRERYLDDLKWRADYKKETVQKIQGNNLIAEIRRVISRVYYSRYLFLEDKRAIKYSAIVTWWKYFNNKKHTELIQKIEEGGYFEESIDELYLKQK